VVGDADMNGSLLTLELRLCLDVTKITAMLSRLLMGWGGSSNRAARLWLARGPDAIISELNKRKPYFVTMDTAEPLQRTYDHPPPDPVRDLVRSHS